VRLVPFVSLAIGLVAALSAWARRGRFRDHPYAHWFVTLHLTAVGLHQFEEYGWPGGFRDFFAAAFVPAQAVRSVPSTAALELLNALGLTLVFGLVGWLGTRIVWVGLALLFLSSANGFFHLTHTVSHWTYVPGTVTGTLLYLPLALLAARFAVRRNDVGAPGLLAALWLGTAVSLAPFVHVRIAQLWLTR
jgi:hypothetical protein